MFRPLLRPAKRALTHLLRLGPFSSATLGPPKGCFRQTADWVAHYNHGHQSRPSDHREIVPAQEVVRALPGTLEENIHWKFRPLLRQSHAPCFVTVIPGGRVWGRNGAVVTPDDWLLGDVSRESADSARQHSALLRLRLGPLRRLKGRIAVLSTVWSNVYFHWMFDLLPRIGLLRAAGLFESVDAFIVPPQTLPFQTDTWQPLGLGAARLIVAEDPWSFHAVADELVVPSLPSALDTPRQWGCDFLRESFQGVIGSARPRGRRLYISRARAAGRRIVNAREVEALLLARGFETVHLENLPVAEQASLFASAEVIVAPHGAGLTNIVFCEANTVVVDIFSPNYVNTCYWVVAQECRLRYYYLIGSGDRPLEGVDPDRKGDDIMVDLLMLQNLLDETGCQEP